FYFLEMNTRLQVEHPVTEAITGVDLVEQMIRVAYGEQLAMTQDDIALDGWAIENRVYAEDPYRGFLPSTGRLIDYSPSLPGWTEDEEVAGKPRRGVAHGAGSIRVDDGVYEGGEVSIYYDPMIAKLITWAPTRDEAADLQIEALDSFCIKGLSHNVDFLSAVMQNETFRSGELTTGFISEEYPDGFHGAPISENMQRMLAAICAGNEFTLQNRSRRISGQLDGHDGESGVNRVTTEWVVKIGDSRHEVILDDGYAMVDGVRVDGHCDWLPGMVEARATDAKGETYGLIVERDGNHWVITTRGAATRALALPLSLKSHEGRMLEKVPPDLSKMLICPMPGMLVKLHVGEGDTVQPGQPLATVEAMKMENILRAEKEGTIAKINAGEGDSLAVDAVILELE
ncbi:MAG: biotin/lipoyl-containing protein, partial [Pseudomonadota bacterium]